MTKRTDNAFNASMTEITEQVAYRDTDELESSTINLLRINDSVTLYHNRHHRSENAHIPREDRDQFVVDEDDDSSGSRAAGKHRIMFTEIVRNKPTAVSATQISQPPSSNISAEVNNIRSDSELVGMDHVDSDATNQSAQSSQQITSPTQVQSSKQNDAQSNPLKLPKSFDEDGQQNNSSKTVKCVAQEHKSQRTRLSDAYNGDNARIEEIDPQLAMHAIFVESSGDTQFTTILNKESATNKNQDYDQEIHCKDLKKQHVAFDSPSNRAYLPKNCQVHKAEDNRTDEYVNSKYKRNDEMTFFNSNTNKDTKNLEFEAKFESNLEYDKKQASLSCQKNSQPIKTCENHFINYRSEYSTNSKFANNSNSTKHYTSDFQNHVENKNNYNAIINSSLDEYSYMNKIKEIENLKLKKYLLLVNNIDTMINDVMIFSRESKNTSGPELKDYEHSSPNSCESAEIQSIGKCKRTLMKVNSEYKEMFQVNNNNLSGSNIRSSSHENLSEVNLAYQEEILSKLNSLESYLVSKTKLNLSKSQKDQLIKKLDLITTDLLFIDRMNKLLKAEEENKKLNKTKYSTKQKIKDTTSKSSTRKDRTSEEKEDELMDEATSNSSIIQRSSNSETNKGRRGYSNTKQSTNQNKSIKSLAASNNPMSYKSSLKRTDKNLTSEHSTLKSSVNKDIENDHEKSRGSDTSHSRTKKDNEEDEMIEEWAVESPDGETQDKNEPHRSIPIDSENDALNRDYVNYGSTDASVHSKNTNNDGAKINQNTRVKSQASDDAEAKAASSVGKSKKSSERSHQLSDSTTGSKRNPASNSDKEKAELPSEVESLKKAASNEDDSTSSSAEIYKRSAVLARSASKHSSVDRQPNSTGNESEKQAGQSIHMNSKKSLAREQDAVGKTSDQDKSTRSLGSNNAASEKQAQSVHMYSNKSLMQSQGTVGKASDHVKSNKSIGANDTAVEAKIVKQMVQIFTSANPSMKSVDNIDKDDRDAKSKLSDTSNYSRKNRPINSVNEIADELKNNEEDRNSIYKIQSYINPDVFGRSISQNRSAVEPLNRESENMIVKQSVNLFKSANSSLKAAIRIENPVIKCKMSDASNYSEKNRRTNSVRDEELIEESSPEKASIDQGTLKSNSPASIQIKIKNTGASINSKNANIDIDAAQTRFSDPDVDRNKSLPTADAQERSSAQGVKSSSVASNHASQNPSLKSAEIVDDKYSTRSKMSDASNRSRINENPEKDEKSLVDVDSQQYLVKLNSRKSDEAPSEAVNSKKYSGTNQSIDSKLAGSQSGDEKKKRFSLSMSRIKSMSNADAVSRSSSLNKSAKVSQVPSQMSDNSVRKPAGDIPASARSSLKSQTNNIGHEIGKREDLLKEDSTTKSKKSVNLFEKKETLNTPFPINRDIVTASNKFSANENYNMYNKSSIFKEIATGLTRLSMAIDKKDNAPYSAIVIGFRDVYNPEEYSVNVFRKSESKVKCENVVYDSERSARSKHSTGEARSNISLALKTGFKPSSRQILSSSVGDRVEASNSNAKLRPNSESQRDSSQRDVANTTASEQNIDAIEPVQQSKVFSKKSTSRKLELEIPLHPSTENMSFKGKYRGVSPDNPKTGRQKAINSAAKSDSKHQSSDDNKWELIYAAGNEYKNINSHEVNTGAESSDASSKKIQSKSSSGVRKPSKNYELTNKNEIPPKSRSPGHSKTQHFASQEVFEDTLESSNNQSSEELQNTDSSPMKQNSYPNSNRSDMIHKTANSKKEITLLSLDQRASLKDADQENQDVDVKNLGSAVIQYLDENISKVNSRATSNAVSNVPSKSVKSQSKQQHSPYDRVYSVNHVQPIYNLSNNHNATARFYDKDFGIEDTVSSVIDKNNRVLRNTSNIITYPFLEDSLLENLYDEDFYAGIAKNLDFSQKSGRTEALNRSSNSNSYCSVAKPIFSLKNQFMQSNTNEKSTVPKNCNKPNNNYGFSNLTGNYNDQFGSNLRLRNQQDPDATTISHYDPSTAQHPHIDKFADMAHFCCMSHRRMDAENCAAPPGVAANLRSNVVESQTINIQGGFNISGKFNITNGGQDASSTSRANETNGRFVCCDNCGASCSRMVNAARYAGNKINAPNSDAVCRKETANGNEAGYQVNNVVNTADYSIQISTRMVQTINPRSEYKFDIQ